MQNPFRGSPGATVNIAATTTSARVQIAPIATPGEYRIRNGGSVDVFFREGDSSVTATTTTDMSLSAGAIEILTFGSTHLAAITASGTATLYITPGDGI